MADPKTRYVIQYRRLGQHRYGRAMTGEGLTNEASAIRFAEWAAKQSSDLGVRVVEVSQRVVWVRTPDESADP